MNLYNQSCSQSQIGINNSLLFDNQIWRIEDVAEFLGVSVGHIYNLVSRSRKMRRKNEFPYRKCGKLLYFFPKEVLNWIDKGEA